MWHTHITVAAVIEHQNKFLLVSDNTSQGIRLNQPAGHLEASEDLLAAIVREVKEESSMDFVPEGVVGIYLYHPSPEKTYLRVCFSGRLLDYAKVPCPAADDDDVIAAGWYDLTTIQKRASEHRSQLVTQCIDDYLSGQLFPLSMLHNITSRYTKLSSSPITA
ncbi:MAG: NUDIX domain-containing protein [Burkholderiales bacterium]|nr:NUDIX domain-containing protein [Burkholderiales bacterium]